MNQPPPLVPLTESMSANMSTDRQNGLKRTNYYNSEEWDLFGGTISIQSTAIGSIQELNKIDKDKKDKNDQNNDEERDDENNNSSTNRDGNQFISSNVQNNNNTTEDDELDLSYFIN